MDRPPLKSFLSKKRMYKMVFCMIMSTRNFYEILTPIFSIFATVNPHRELFDPTTFVVGDHYTGADYFLLSNIISCRMCRSRIAT